jgi:hypothetical protein
VLVVVPLGLEQPPRICPTVITAIAEPEANNTRREIFMVINEKDSQLDVNDILSQ